MVGVLTVDDQPAFREAARDLIDATPGFEVAAEAASGSEALGMIDALDAALALVDVRMPEMDGVETTRRLRAAAPDLVVVLISIEAAAELPRSVRDCGAATLVRKQSLSPRLLRALWAEHGS